VGAATYRVTTEENFMAKCERATPLLVYEDIPAAHDFLVKAFGFESGGVMRDAQGQAVHGEVRAGDTAIWLHRVAPEHGLASTLAASGLVVYVDDVDAHFTNARAAGARIDSEPVDQPYGLREYGARDLEGHRWWFATPAKAQGNA
jgi:uncharacterized glyoxalase superfamily protein PhnB